MISLDTKRMIYTFYVNDDSFDHPINILHFKLLERYIHKFDEVIFCIIIDDRGRYDLIQRIEEFVIGIFHKKITFKIYDNTNYRESLVFYNEIATQMEHLDGVTFFAHNKGISDDDPIETIKMWVAAMYYFNLEFDLPCDDLNAYFFYGALKSVEAQNSGIREVFIPKHKWFYCGTFYWAKYQELFEYCKRKHISLPIMRNRWYDEHFPGDLVEQENGLSYGGFFMVNGVCLGENIEHYLKTTYSGNLKIFYDFIEFYNSIE